MTTQTKKYNNKDLRRKKIIDSASILFSRKSYHEVMMEDVAKLASIAKGTLYNYYSSKEELYFSIMKLRMEKLIFSLKEKMESEISSIDSLHSFIVHHYMFMMKYQNFFLMYQKESLKGDHQLASELCLLDNELKNILKKIIKAGKKENLFRNLEEGFVVDMVLGSIYGAVHRGIENNYSEEQMISDREIIFDFVLHGLFTGFDNTAPFPLKDITIVITRTVEQSKESSDVFRQLGANVIVFPTLDILPPNSWKEFDDIVTGDEQIDFIIFTSAHAVKMFIKRSEETGIKFNYDKTKIVAVGNKTASVCERNKIPVHIIPKKFSGDGVIDELAKYELTKKIVFIPRSVIGREELPSGLAEMGANIKTAPVYNIALPPDEKIKTNLEKLNLSKPDLFIFTSPSTFENFLQILNIKNPVQYFNNYVVAAIGPTTKAAIEKKNVKVNIMPGEFTIDGLVKAIVKHYKK